MVFPTSVLEFELFYQTIPLHVSDVKQQQPIALILLANIGGDTHYVHFMAAIVTMIWG
eukprot:m.151664 g.151664  ORF g.151664 m.151664 type:complete len:58 (+) comp13295_c0_seq4:1711-1884(+)